METVRTTFKEKLKPTPEQERALEAVLWRCRTLYHAALEQRITWWRRGQGKSVTRFQQETELKAIREAYPEYAAIHSHVLQDVLARLDKTYQAFFRRMAAGEKKAGFPRFQGRNRWHSFTYKEYGNGARLDNGSLVLSKIGRLAVRWSRPVVGTIKTVTVSHEADGWYVCFSCAEVPIRPLPPTGQETGIDVGLVHFLTRADGVHVPNPRHLRTAEREVKKAQRRVSRRKKGSTRRRKAAKLLARKHQHVKRQRRDFHHKQALALVRTYDTVYVEAIQPANLSRRPAPVPDGNGGSPQRGQPQGRPQHVHSRRRMAPIPVHSRVQGSMRREASGSGATGVHQPGVQRVRGTDTKEPVRAYPRLHDLRADPGPRRERGQKHSMARTAPSGTRGDACGDEPRTRRPLGRAECQVWLSSGCCMVDVRGRHRP
jgi:putative transposase